MWKIFLSFFSLSFINLQINKLWNYPRLRQFRPSMAATARNALALDNYFSEFALIRYRVRVEIEYFISLCAIPLPNLSAVRGAVFERLRDIYRDFSLEDAAEVKRIEATTNHVT